MKNFTHAPLLVLALPLVAGLGLGAGGDQKDPCKQMAFEAYRSCTNEATSDLWLARGKCTNIADLTERIECIVEAYGEFVEARSECWEIRGARLELCEDLGGGVYAPEIDPADFVAVIDNPYLPFIPGTTFIYETVDPEEVEHIEVIVTDDTIDILGVECTVVRDTVTVDGELVEDTYDWFAQDVDGNVWYFGELSLNYEDGELVDIDGSWKAGVDGAYPGIVMPASPQIGEVNRLEFLLREAEDVAVALSLDESVQVPYGAFSGCLQTEDYSPLEPDALEYKYYSPGLGFVLEIKPDTGERLELIDVIYN